MDSSELITPRLRLQPGSHCEGWEVWDLWREPALRRRVFGDALLEFGGAQDGLDMFVGRTPGLWLIRDKETSHLLGCVSLTRLAQVRRESRAGVGPATELNVALLPIVWGRGYACESARAVLELAISAEDVEVISATTDAADVRGRVMLDRLGFKALREVRSGSKPRVEYELASQDFRPVPA